MCNSADMQANNWLEKFFDSIRVQEYEGTTDIFEDNACWRDLLAFSWNIITVAGIDDIANMFKSTAAQVSVQEWELSLIHI